MSKDIGFVTEEAIREANEKRIGYKAYHVARKLGKREDLFSINGTGPHYGSKVDNTAFVYHKEKLIVEYHSQKDTEGERFSWVELKIKHGWNDPILVYAHHKHAGDDQKTISTYDPNEYAENLLNEAFSEVEANKAEGISQVRTERLLKEVS
ncbi:hypothetical protein HQ533_01755 [Candidatus Woesearchaeota archaeon]|nr:hypothetical protein [Candidatus Woesearchaeota archaeon]